MTQVYEFYDMGVKMPIIRNTDVELTPGSVENTYRRILVSPDKGSGAITLGEETHTLGPGDVILAPAGIKHMVANRSNKPMGFLFFYPAVEVHIENV